MSSAMTITGIGRSCWCSDWQTYIASRPKRYLNTAYELKLKETNFCRSEEYDYFRLVVLGIVNDGRRREDPAGKAEEAADKQV